MIISNTIVKTVSIFIVVLITTLIIIKSRSATTEVSLINNKIYVGYIPGIGGGVSFDINYNENKVSTLSAGYGITEELPINEGNTTDAIFICNFKEILKNKSRVIKFTKNNDNLDISVDIEGADTINRSISTYKIQDIGFIYKTFTTVDRKLIAVPTPFYTSPNNYIYVGYVGVSEEDYLNIIFFDIDYQGKNIYTIRSDNYESIKGEISGDVNSTNFKVKFTNSFLGDNREFIFDNIDSDSYNVRISDSRIEFPSERLNIIDISKIYSLLLEKGVIGVNFRKLLYNKTGQKSGKTMLKYGFPNRIQARSKKFLKTYLSSRDRLSVTAPKG